MLILWILTIFCQSLRLNDHFDIYNSIFNTARKLRSRYALTRKWRPPPPSNGECHLLSRSSGDRHMTPAVEFERELEIFRTEAETAIQCLYAYLAIHSLTKKSRSLPGLARSSRTRTFVSYNVS
jgi:hypothetical protein